MYSSIVSGIIVSNIGISFLLLRRYSKKLFDSVFSIIPFYKSIIETRNTQTPIKFSHYFIQKILRINASVYWPMHHSSMFSGKVENIYVGVDTNPGYMPGCYIQAVNKIFIGDYTQIGPGVGIISTNHNLYDNSINDIEGGIYIGKYCWLGMHSKILPEVTLGDFTIVAAGAIVTKSFPEGYCVLAGVPAKQLKKLNPDLCRKYDYNVKYQGFLKVKNFKTSREYEFSKSL